MSEKFNDTLKAGWEFFEKKLEQRQQLPDVTDQAVEDTLKAIVETRRENSRF